MDATEKYTAGKIRQYTVQAIDFIIKHGTENTTDGKWHYDYNDMPPEVCPRDVLNLQFMALPTILLNRPEIVNVRFDLDEWKITFDPAYCVHCPETTPIPKEGAIDDELQKKLESAAAFIVEYGANETTSGQYYTNPERIPADILSPEMVEQYKEEIVDALYTFDAVAEADIDDDGEFDVTYYLDYCPNFEPDREEMDEYPEDRPISDPLARTEYEEMQAMLAECRPAVIPEKDVQHPPVYMATLPHAREHGELDAFKQSRDLNRACADAIDNAIHNSNYKTFHYDMETAAGQVIGKYGMERTKIILASTVQIKDYDGRFSTDNKKWAKGITLPAVPHTSRFDFYSDIHPTLLDGFINRVRQMERDAEKAPAEKKSVLGQLKENKKAVAAKPPAKGKDKASTNDMEV